MRTEKEIRTMRTRLEEMLPRLDRLFRKNKPKPYFFGMFSKGDMYQANRAFQQKQEIRQSILVIDWIIKFKRLTPFDEDMDDVDACIKRWELDANLVTDETGGSK